MTPEQDQLFTDRDLYEAQSPETLATMEADLREVINRSIGQIALIHDVLAGYGYELRDTETLCHIRKAEA